MMTQKIKNNLRKIYIPKYTNVIALVAIFGLIGAYLVFSGSALAPYTSSDITAVKTLGLYPGFGNESGRIKLENMENFLGRRITFADANLDHTTWQAFGGSSWGNFENSTSLFRNRTDVTPALTIPLRTSEVGAQTNKTGGPEIIRKELQDTANGLNDDKYRQVAERLVKFGQAKTILRIGHEPDITYYPWSFRNGNEDVYIKAFRHIVDLFRSTPGNQFLVDYQGNGAFSSSYTSPRTGVTQPYGDAGYPGDAYVDIIGVDVYNRQSWAGVKARLDYTLTLAKKHSKPMSIPEWGLWFDETGDDPSFIQNMYDWINTTPKTGPGRMVYHSYFQGNTQASLDRAPNSKAKFKELFSIKGSGISQPPTPTPPPPPPPTSLPNVNIVPGSIVTIPAAPKAGDEVSFQVTIKNDGTGATPAGIIHGVSFWVNNANVAWSDNSTASLAAGATRVLTTNGGPDGNATWKATQGSIAVTAKWDDITPPRITESDTIKDTEERTITVAAATTTPPPPPADTTPPTSTINTTPSGPISATTLTLAVTATDNVALSKVTIEVVGGAEIASDTTAPYSLNVDTKALANGNYQLQAVSYDTSGNKTISSPILIKVRLTDINRSGTVEIGDLTAVISNWNQSNPAIATKVAYDLDDDGVIGIGDLTKLISAWGS